jgi:alpha-amylase
VGEVFDGDMGYHHSFMAGMDATLNYPFYFTMRDIFANNKDMWGIRTYYLNWGNYIDNTQLSYQANFVDNHDNARWLSS